MGRPWSGVATSPTVVRRRLREQHDIHVIAHLQPGLGGEALGDQDLPGLAGVRQTTAHQPVSPHVGAPRAVDRGEHADAPERVGEALGRRAGLRGEGYPCDQPQLPHPGKVGDRGVEGLRRRLRVARW